MASPGQPLSRREFNRLVLAAAPALAAGSSREIVSTVPPQGILELRLLAPDLPAQREFYHRKLGLPVVEEGAEQVTLQAGGTRLTFLRAREEDGRPNYHFAFNIPENQLDSARKWLAERTPIVSNDGREVFHFPGWNAHAVYFHDPAGNLGELIARHDLPNAAPGPFSERMILYASEIGVVVDDLAGAVKALGTHLGLPVYRPGSATLVPVGDEHRLLIVVSRGHPWMKTPADVYPTVARLAGDAPARYAVPGYPYELSLAPRPA